MTSTTVIDHGNLQRGIYLSPANPPPPAFLFAVIDIEGGAGAGEAHDALVRLHDVLVDLRAGVVRDLAAERPGEESGASGLDSFDFLIGYGARLFAPDRDLTEKARPDLLADLVHPGDPFASLPWAEGVIANRGSGDVCLQLTGASAHKVNRALIEAWKVIIDEQLPLVIQQSFSGFARDDRRSWIGFHDGLSNIRPSQRRAAVECQGDPGWNRGGTYLAFLRCAVDLRPWRALSRDEQELLGGRDKLLGAGLASTTGGQAGPLGQPFSRPGSDAEDPAQGGGDFLDPPETGDRLIEASHIHRANQNRAEPTTPAAHRIFRQGYEYLDGAELNEVALGLNFVSFQRDLEHIWQILGLPTWLAGVNFGGVGEHLDFQLITLEAGGLFAVPPQGEPFPGAELFRASGPPPVDPHPLP